MTDGPRAGFLDGVRLECACGYMEPAWEEHAAAAFPDVIEFDCPKCHRTLRAEVTVTVVDEE